MNPTLVICAVPLMLVVLALVTTNMATIRRTTTIAYWFEFVLIGQLMLPVLCVDKGTLTLGPGLFVNQLGACFVLLTTLVVATCVTHSDIYFQCETPEDAGPENWNARIYYLATNLFFISMVFVFFCDNLGFLWMSIEASTLSSAPLVYYYRTKKALEATWKYLIICSVGIAFALLGTVFIFGSSQHGALPNGSLSISELIANGPRLDYSLLRLGFIACLIGYGTKAGIFPLHSWIPDAYSEAPAPASALLSGGLGNCALYAIYKISQILAASRPNSTPYEFIVVLGTITVVAASILLIRQQGIKRLWAYSSIENIGIMLVAIGLGSGVLFFLQALNHSLGKVAAFLLSGNIIQAFGTRKLHNLHGVLKSSPLWGGLTALAALSVTGAPPFGSFISEVAILSQSATEKHWVITLFLVLSILVSFVAVSTHVGRILLGTPKATFKPFKPMQTSLVPAFLMALAFLLGITVNISALVALK